VPKKQGRGNYFSAGGDSATVSAWMVRRAPRRMRSRGARRMRSGKGALGQQVAAAVDGKCVV
jgi:hypothetical protein